MTKEQLNAIFNKYGGKETFIKEKLLFIQLDNSNFIYANFKLKPEERLEEIVFDDDNELLYYYAKDPSINVTMNDYRPIKTTEIYPYDVIQNINVCDGIYYPKK